MGKKSRGRPPLDESDRRKPRGVWFSDGEWAEVSAAAASAEEGQSEYVRKASLKRARKKK